MKWLGVSLAKLVAGVLIGLVVASSLMLIVLFLVGWDP